MRREGCAWSVLFARPDARALYTRLGWQPAPSRYRAGLLAGMGLPSQDEYLVRSYDPRAAAEGWQPLEAAYASYNARRPLTLIRDPHYWRGYAAWMCNDWIAQHRAVVLVAARACGAICGYALAHFYDHAYAQQYYGSPPWFYVSEIGARDSESGAIPALLAAVAQEARQRGMGYGQLALPSEPQVDAALAALFGETLEEHSQPGMMMLRALAPGAAEAFEAARLASGAIFWELDRY
jgi:hypothetical protein